MKFIVFLILFLSSFDAISHPVLRYTAQEITISLNFPNYITIIDKPELSRLKSIESYSWDSILYVQKQNEDTYDKMKIDLEEKLYDSLINDSIFLLNSLTSKGVKIYLYLPMRLVHSLPIRDQIILKC